MFQSRRDPGMALRREELERIGAAGICFNPVVIRAWRCAGGKHQADRGVRAGFNPVVIRAWRCASA